MMSLGGAHTDAQALEEDAGACGATESSSPSYPAPAGVLIAEV